MILDKLFNLFVLQFLNCRKDMIILQRVFGRIKWITICRTFRPVSSTFLLGFISDCCCSVVSNSLHPHELPHARLPWFLLSLGVCSDSCLLSWWCHPTISSSVIPFSSCPQSFPASGSFPVSQPFPSGGQSIGASASASVLPMNIQGLFPFRIDWLDLLAVQGTLKSLLQHHNSKASILRCSAFFIVQLTSIHDYWKNHSFN